MKVIPRKKANISLRVRLQAVNATAILFLSLYDPICERINNMKLQCFWKLTKKIHFLSVIFAGTWLASFANITKAEDMPNFRKGMWEFKRTVDNADRPGKPQTTETKKCTNPSEDMKRQKEMLSKAGCKFAPVSKSGNSYSFTTDCNIQGVAGQSKSLITVENDSAYSVKVESRMGAQVTKEVLLARRTGDCAE